MSKDNIVSGIIFILIGALFIGPSIKLGISPSTSDGVLGAGFYPFVIAVIQITLGSLILLTGFLKKTVESTNEIIKENIKPLIITIMAIIIYLIIWKFTSFIIATIVLCLFLNWFYERNIKFNIIFTTVLVGLIHIVFTTLLRIQFVI